MSKMKGSTYFAKLLKENGTTHVFYQDALLPQTIKEMNEWYAAFQRGSL